MRIGSLFSGAAGLDRAVEEVFGAQVAWFSEYDKAASKVLAYRYPGVPNHGDITQIDWDAVEPIDILCGGWPCQPFSLAGKQKGINDERALWSYVAGAIRVLRPRFVVLENVSAVLTAGEFDRVANDLAESGYQFGWTCARASDVGAPHRRERLFVVAHTAGDGPGERFVPLIGGLPTAVGGSGSHVSSVKLLPTPKSAERGDCQSEHNRNDPDLRAATYHFPDGAWGDYEAAIRRWESVTRPAPAPTEPNSKGNPRLSAEFAGWMMGWPAGWVTDQAIGISLSDQLKCIGNGVVPQCASAAISVLVNVIEVAA